MVFEHRLRSECLLVSHFSLLTLTLIRLWRLKILTISTIGSTKPASPLTLTPPCSPRRPLPLPRLLPGATVPHEVRSHFPRPLHLQDQIPQRQTARNHNPKP